VPSQPSWPRLRPASR